MKKYKTARELVNELISQGHKVEFRERKDRKGVSTKSGIRITKIDKEKFTGSKGIAKAREILGVTISTRRQVQLKNIGKYGNKPKVYDPLSPELKKIISRVQRKFRTGEHKKGTVTRKQVRYSIQAYGIEETLKRLENAERYAEGKAYLGSLESYLERLQTLRTSNKYNSVEELINMVQEIIDINKGRKFLQSDFNALIMSWYDFIEGKMDYSSFFNQSFSILNKYTEHD